MAKIKPAKRRSSEKLVEGARDHILDTYEEAEELLTERECLDLIKTLREDLDLRQSEIEYAIENRRHQRHASKRPIDVVPKGTRMKKEAP
jgi:CHASE3 domain sensor protein